MKDKLFLQKEYILKNPDVDFLHTNEIWFKNGKLTENPWKVNGRSGPTGQWTKKLEVFSHFR